MQMRHAMRTASEGRPYTFHDEFSSSLAGVFPAEDFPKNIRVGHVGFTRGLYQAEFVGEAPTIWNSPIGRKKDKDRVRRA